MRPDMLALPEELFFFARIPKEDQTPELIKFAMHSIEKWTVLLYGSHWQEKILHEKVALACDEVLAHVEIDLFEPDVQRGEILRNIIKHAEWWSRTTYQTIRHFLRHKLKPMEAIEKTCDVTAKIRVAKGGFEHYEEIKNSLFKLQNMGVNIAVLKGVDSKLGGISKELEEHKIPCRSWKPNRPALRYYIVDDAYLLLFSHGNGQFTVTGGEKGEGADYICRLWNYDWSQAQPGNKIPGGKIL